MGHRRILALTVSAAALLSAGQAFAQQFYIGLGAESGTNLTDWNPGGSPDLHVGSLSLASVLAGAKFDFGGPFYAGAEAETTLSINYTNDLNAFDGLTGLTRVRGIIGYDFGGFDLFAAAGVVQLSGNLDDHGAGASGMTYGVGINTSVGNNIDLRIEAIMDSATTNSPDAYTWDATSVRAAAIYKF